MGSTETVTSSSLNRIIKDEKVGDIFSGYLLNAGKKMPVGFDVVIDEFGRSIVDVNGLYNEKYMKAMGYDTEEFVEIETLSEDALLQWMRNKVNPGISSISDYSEGLISLTEVALNDLEVTYKDFSIASKRLTAEDGKRYVYMTAVNNGEMYDIVLYMEGKDCIDAYAKKEGYSVSSYPSTYTVSKGFYFWEATLVKKGVSSVVNVPFTYKYISRFDILNAMCKDIEKKYNGYIYSLMSEPDSEGYTHVLGRAKVTVTYLGNFEYTVTSTILSGSIYGADGEEGTGPGAQAQILGVAVVRELIRKDLEKLRVIRMYYTLDGEVHFYYNYSSTIGPKVKVKKRATTFPMIPLKERFQYIKNKHIDAILNKIGMNSDDFKESLNQSEIASAYVVFGVPIKHTNSAVVRVIYETLKVLVKGKTSSGSNKLHRRREDIRLNYTNMAGISVAINTESEMRIGTIGPVGTITREAVDYEIEVWEDGISYMQPAIALVFRKQETEDSYFEIVVYDASTTYHFGDMSLRPNGLHDPGCILPIIREVYQELNFKDKCSVLGISMHVLVYTQVEVKTEWYQSMLFQFVMSAVTLYVGGPIVFALSSAVSLGLGALLGKELMAVIAVVMIVYGGYQAIGQTGFEAGLAAAATLVQTVNFANNLIIQKDLKSLAASSESATSANAAEQRKLAETLESIRNPLLMAQTNRLDEIDTYYTIATGDFQYNFDMLYDYATVFSNGQVQV